MIEPVTLRRVPVRMFLPEGCGRVTPVITREREWETASTQWILEHVRRGDTFVDVGAHAGYFTLIVARAVGPEGHVYAFEPDPTNFALLERNVKLNGFRNVTIEQKAVSDRNETRKLYLSTKNSGDHRLCQTDERREAIEVHTVALDDYLRGSGPVHLVKVDTQGAEVLVLGGARETLRANPRARLLVEFWPHGLAGLGSSALRLLKLLNDCGFVLSEAEVARLLTCYTFANRRHCNLMLEPHSVGEEATA